MLFLMENLLPFSEGKEEIHCINVPRSPCMNKTRFHESPSKKLKKKVHLLPENPISSKTKRPSNLDLFLCILPSFLPNPRPLLSLSPLPSLLVLPMNNGGSHYPFHGHNNSVNLTQRFREEPQLPLGALGQTPLQVLPGADASSSYAQPLVQSQAARACHPGYHQEAGRRPAHHEAYVGGALSPGAAQPAQESRPRIFGGSPSSQPMAGHGHLHAAQQMEIRRRPLEENAALRSPLLSLSSNCTGVVPSPRNQAQVVANGGLEHGSSSSARGKDGIPFMPLPATSNSSGESSRSARPQQPRLVDYMGVQGVRVALGDVKTMIGSLRGTLFDARANQGETNDVMINLELTLGCSEIIDLTLRL